MPNMVNTGLISAPPQVRCRRIEDADADNIVSLLTRGFAPRRPRRFWEHVIASLAARATPADVPKYGYLLESNGAAVGAILQIYSTQHAGGAGSPAATTRCNVSSWYVEPAFRSYAPFLVAQAVKQKGVTYLNISSAPHTRPIVEAQGYLRFSNGVFAALPCLSGPPDVDVRVTAADPRAHCEVHERDVLRDHLAYGCMSLWCETRERAYPFVFRARRVKGLITCTQPIYCRAIAHPVPFARPLGRYLALRGRPVISTPTVRYAASSANISTRPCRNISRDQPAAAGRPRL